MSSESFPTDDVQPGERIGRYTVLRRLGSGGMAEVYLARQEGPKNFSKVVVIKQVLPRLVKNDKFIQMFLDEGRLAARLSHPNIAQTFELGEEAGRFHIAMEYVAGESLAKVMKRAKRAGQAIPLGILLRVAVQLLEALDYTHDLKGERGEWLRVVHRDVSPTNVVLTYYGGVKLLDFGIARAASHQHQTQVGTVKGKGGYMAPEQAKAQHVDQRADIYAVGALLYLLATGVGPFDDAGDVFAMMRAAVESRFPRPSERTRDINPQLEQIILKAMAGKPDDRYPSARMMLAELEGCATSQRLFAGARELALFMRLLFGERAELAHSWDETPDEEMIDRLAESFSDQDEILETPTLRARRPKAVPLELKLSSEPTVRGSPLPMPGARPRGAFDEDDHATEMVISRPEIPTRPIRKAPRLPEITGPALRIPAAFIPVPRDPEATGNTIPTLPGAAVTIPPNHQFTIVVTAIAAILIGVALFWALA